MNNKNLVQYINFIKKRYPKISEMMIEKDYYLSLFLTKTKQLILKEELKEFDNLIFKGGTLLTKLYLKYHRISEDLDFSYIYSNEIRNKGTINKIDKHIKKIELDLINDIKSISDACGFTFKIDRSKDSKYVTIINKRTTCIFSIYYKSKYLSINESKIKIDINFIENRLYDYIDCALLNLTDIIKLSDLDQIELKSLKYDLDLVNFKIYNINEVILEKYRAIITRKEIQERDIFDLFLINKNIDVLSVDSKLIINKIKSSFKFSKIYNKNYNNNLDKIKDNKITFIDKLSDLTLIDYDLNKFSEFKFNIINKISKFNYIR